MKNTIYIIVLIIITISCKEENKEIKIDKVQDKENSTNWKVIEKKYAINDVYEIGDVRRYGIIIGENDKIHPYSKKSTIETVLEISSKYKFPILFPEGTYNFGIFIKGLENVEIISKNAKFTGPIYIIDNDSLKKSKDIKVSGVITTYYKVFMRNSKDIEFDKLIITSDISKNSIKSSSMGCDIYAGVDYVYINELEINGVGSSADNHTLTRAALQVHGWNNNPSNLEINKITITNCDRHAIYLTGNNHIINNINIDSYGNGNYNNVSDLEDSEKGDTQKIKGLWLNKCNNSSIGSVTINTNDSKGTYSVWLDEGNIGEPTTIEKVTLIGGDKKLPIFANELSNCVIRKLVK